MRAVGETCTWGGGVTLDIEVNRRKECPKKTIRSIFFVIFFDDGVGVSARVSAMQRSSISANVSLEEIIFSPHK